MVVNKHLLNDLTDMGLWTPELKNKLIHYSGSIQNLNELPSHLKGIYK
jgi:ribonucleoside-diphosphate reductase subunit M1